MYPPTATDVFFYTWKITPVIILTLEIISKQEIFSDQTKMWKNTTSAVRSSPVKLASKVWIPTSVRFFTRDILTVKGRAPSHPKKY